MMQVSIKKNSVDDKNEGCPAGRATEKIEQALLKPCMLCPVFSNLFCYHPWTSISEPADIGWFNC
jgi:hypothetical protein